MINVVQDKFLGQLSPKVKLMRIAIIGNSGSGKTTLARRLTSVNESRLLELDSIYWEPGKIAEKRSADANWIIEGCYGSLLTIVKDKIDLLIFMNPGVEKCVANNLKRPWEPEKYKSLEEQNEKLEFLVQWVKEYYERHDEMSLQAHTKFFDEFDGAKLEVKNSG
jgi:adenylate kinase family enzyme